MDLNTMRSELERQNFDIIAFVGKCRELDGTQLAEALTAVEGTVADELNQHMKHSEDEIKTLLTHVLEACSQPHILQLSEQLTDTLKAYQAQLEETEKFYLTVLGRYKRLEYVIRKRDTTLKLKRAQRYCAAFLAKPTGKLNLFELEVAIERFRWIKRLAGELETDGTQSPHFELDSELWKYEEALEKRIENSMAQCLRDEKETETALLLRMLVRANKLSLLENGFKTHTVLPKLETIARSSLEESKESLFNFPAIVDKVQHFLTALRIKWNAPLKTAYGEQHIGKFWIKACLGPVLAWMVASLSSIFVPSNLDAFKKSFEKGLGFVSAMEAEFCEFEDELECFRQHSAWSAFMRKWNLSQYYQQRVKQLAMPVQSIMAYKLQLGTEPRVLEQTLVAINALMHIWSSAVIVTPLLPKFHKLTLQISSFYLEFASLSGSVAGTQDPTTLVQDALQKHYNLKYFRDSLQAKVLPAMEEFKVEGFEALASQLVAGIDAKIGQRLEAYRDQILHETLAMYHAYFDRKPGSKELESFSLRPLVVLSQSHADFKLAEVGGLSDLQDHTQSILVLVNRAVFRILESADAGAKAALQRFPDRMREIETEAVLLGYRDLASEPFWQEIHAALNQA